MVAYYPFDGTFADNFGNQTRDFQPGSGDAQPGFAPGYIGQAAAFDGIDDFAVTTSYLTEDFSVAFWIKTTDSYELGMKEFWNGKGILNANIVGCAYDVGDWGICLQATSKAGFGIGTLCEETDDVLSATPINNGQWHFVCCTRDGTTGEYSVYVDNGGPEDTKTLTPAYPLLPVPMYLASTNEEPGKFLNASIDELMIFDHVLTQREIDMIRDQGILYRPAVPVYPKPLPDPEGFNIPSGSVFQWYSGYSGPGVVDRYTLRVDSDVDRITDPNEAGMGDYLVWQEDILPQSPADSNALWTVHGIQDDATYYWRVDTLVLDPNLATMNPEIPHWIEGPVWSFYGISATPKISEPNSFTILPNPNTHEIDTPQVAFTADIVAGFPIHSIEWLKDGQPLNIDGIKYSVQNTPCLSAAQSSTLTVHTPEESDTGGYACKVTLVNSNHDTGPEGRLYVASEVLVHRWSFNQDAGELTVLDCVGDAHGAIIDPNEGTIAFDGAGRLVWSNPLSPGIALSGDPNYAAWVDLPGGLISDLHNNLALMAWYTWDDPQMRSLSRLFSAGRDDRFELAVKDVNGRIRFRGTAMEDPVFLDADPADNLLGQEVCIAVVWDGAAGQVSLYQNGQFKGSAPTGMDLAALDDLDIWLGRSQGPAHPLFVGSINELRIYNVPLIGPWVKALYDLGPDGEPMDPEIVNPCVLPVPEGADINGDCAVDLADFAILARHWLECGLVSCF